MHKRLISLCIFANIIPPIFEVTMNFPAPWLPAAGAVYFPCTRPGFTYAIKPAMGNGSRVPTICGHGAWIREHIVIQGGFVALELFHPERAPPTRQSFPSWFGLTRHTTSVPSQIPIPHCTVCQLGNNLHTAVLCAWCGRLIFPGSLAWLADDAAISPLEITATKSKWDHRVIVCNYEPCRSQAQAQVFGGTVPIHGRWSDRYALVVDPR